MKTLFSDLRYKEVINIKTGQRLGYVGDMEIDSASGNIIALIVPSQGKLGGVFGRGDGQVILWESINRIGEDIIIVEV